MREDGRRKMIINAKKGAFLEKKSYIRNVKLK
jgi:hypothetical protein